MALNKKGGLGKGLGKGIDSLISNAYAVETKKKDSAADKKEPETTVKLRLVEPASSQPRLKFDEDTLTELAESIKFQSWLRRCRLHKTQLYCCLWLFFISC